MQLGMYTPIENAARMAAGGWRFIEENIVDFLQGDTSDDDWNGLTRIRNSCLPVLAANRLLPTHLKAVGPEFDLERLQTYMRRVIRRAAQVGTKTLIFGSGPARTVPANFDRASAQSQLIEFLQMGVEIAAEFNVLVVAEPLNRDECNIMNSVAECMQYVHRIHHPNFQCLVDSYHHWKDNEPIEPLIEAMPWIQHVHVSDVENRNVPTERSPHDYHGFFAVLKKNGYDGSIAVESPTDRRVLTAPAEVFSCVSRFWNEA